MITLDHLAIACTDLTEGTAWVEEQLGVTLQPGGQHARYGTHNTLLGLADGLYLEVIAIDPHATPEAGHSWFALDHFTGPPRLANWICQTDDLSNLPELAGQAQSLSRGDLNWQIMVPDDGSLPMDGGFPTLIKWAEGTHHPAERLPQSGVRLTRLDVTHPEAEQISAMVHITDPRGHLNSGAFALRAEFDTPNGPKVLA